MSWLGSSSTSLYLKFASAHPFSSLSCYVPCSSPRLGRRQCWTFVAHLHVSWPRGRSKHAHQRCLRAHNHRPICSRAPHCHLSLLAHRLQTQPCIAQPPRYLSFRHDPSVLSVGGVSCSVYHPLLIHCFYRMYAAEIFNPNPPIALCATQAALLEGVQCT